MLYILEKDYSKIIKHCMEWLPYEACGLAGGIKHGDDIFIQKIYLLTNTEASTNHFTMDVVFCRLSTNYFNLNKSKSTMKIQDYLCTFRTSEFLCQNSFIPIFNKL